MSKIPTVAQHYVITVYNNMFDRTEEVVRSFIMKKIPWKNDSYFVVKIAQQKLFKYYANVHATTDLVQNSAHMLKCILKLRSFRKWNKMMDINPKDMIVHTTQY
jgi:hypothetical protein